MGFGTRTRELRYTEVLTADDDRWVDHRPWDRVLEPDYPAPAARDVADGDRARTGEGGASRQLDQLTRKEIGRLGERLAAEYLESEGYEILERNYRCREGEADLVAIDPDQGLAVLVEVKTRRAGTIADGTYPEEAVDRRKRQRYRRIAACFVMDRYPTPAVRFDVVGVVLAPDGTASFEHIVGAFDWDAER